jgi:thioredoxin reductase (NADPH)
MAGMDGVEFIRQGRKLYPTAKRVLLTAYADTDAAIQAINEAGIDYYLLKPWDPPEEKLYPILDDLLGDWQAGYCPPFSGLRIVGHRWSSAAHKLKDFLAGHQVPYQYLDIELDPQAQPLLAQFELEGGELPVLITAEGEALIRPDLDELIERLGLKTQAGKDFYDLVVVGGGPAGLAAAVYGASEGLNTMLIERDAPGGQAGSSSRIENYLGFPSGLSGADLARRATAQARRFEVEILAPQEATKVRVEGPYRFITLADGPEIACHVLIVAVGLTYNKLAVPGAEQLAGAGIYYGASLTEVAACQDQKVFIVGAGNSAGQAALYLADHASQVIMLVRGQELAADMSHYLVERIEEHAGIEVWLDTEVTAVHGETHVEAITTRHCQTGAEERHEAAALFIFIGATPSTDWLRGVVKQNEAGFLLTGPDLRENGNWPKDWPLEREPYLLETNVPGIFAIGDVRSSSIKRVASAVGEGSIAIKFVHQYLSRLK